MRLLYVTNGFPFPLTSGYLRHYYLIRELSRQHAITLLSIVDATIAPSSIAALEPFTEQVLTFPSSQKRRSLWRKALGRARSIVASAQGDQALWQMRAAVERLARTEPFDLVLFSGKRTLAAIERLSGVPLVVDMCDATSVRILGSLRYARMRRFPALLLDYVQVRAAERTLMRRAAHLLFASCRDRDALVGRAVAHASVVPNGVDLDFWRRSSPECAPATIIFTGAMSYPPNTDAALYLVNDIVPQVQRVLPDVQTLIVGRDPPPQLVAAGRRPGVTVTGLVDDMRPYLERATVFVAPLRFGAGIQNKLLEAMAMEVPVIASPLAADGLRTEDGQVPPIAVARSRSQFVELIVRCLEGGAHQQARDHVARRYVESSFVWRTSGAKLEQVIDALVGVAHE